MADYLKVQLSQLCIAKVTGGTASQLSPSLSKLRKKTSGNSTGTRSTSRRPAALEDRSHTLLVQQAGEAEDQDSQQKEPECPLRKHRVKAWAAPCDETKLEKKPTVSFCWYARTQVCWYAWHTRGIRSFLGTVFPRSFHTAVLTASPSFDAAALVSGEHPGFAQLHPLQLPPLHPTFLHPTHTPTPPHLHSHPHLPTPTSSPPHPRRPTPTRLTPTSRPLRSLFWPV
jgi:hypothetical protein